jgi:hypothetical protein
MENPLAELKNRLFESIERLSADTLKGGKLDREIKKALAINETANNAVRLMAFRIAEAEKESA